MNPRLLLSTFLCACLAAPALAADGRGEDTIPGPAREDSRGGPPPTILTRAFDLLTEPVFLELGTDHAVWESRSFDTAQFDGIALKTKTEAAAGNIYCVVVWSFGPQDWFADLSPRTAVSTPFGLRFFQADQTAGGNVQGMLGKVRCAAASTEFNNGVPTPASGTVERVRVLLRRG